MKNFCKIKIYTSILHIYIFNVKIQIKFSNSINQIGPIEALHHPRRFQSMVLSSLIFCYLFL